MVVEADDHRPTCSRRRMGALGFDSAALGQPAGPAGRPVPHGHRPPCLELRCGERTPHGTETEHGNGAGRSIGHRKRSFQLGIDTPIVKADRGRWTYPLFSVVLTYS